MGVRESLNRQPKLAGAIGTVVVLVAVGVVWWQLKSAGTILPTMAFYSIDDGKTWFKAEAGEGIVITRDGKPAVRCFVYMTPAGREFVGYLQRANATTSPGATSQTSPGGGGSIQVKRPGQSEWISATSPAAAKIFSVVGPGGEQNAVEVLP